MPFSSAAVFHMKNKLFCEHLVTYGGQAFVPSAFFPQSPLLKPVSSISAAHLVHACLAGTTARAALRTPVPTQRPCFTCLPPTDALPLPLLL